MSPKTSKGKQLVRLNAVRHGMRTVLPVIKGEPAEEWQEHREGIIASLAPDGALETALAERVALQLWRLRRVVAFETAVISSSQQKAVDDYADGERIRQMYAHSVIEAQARADGVTLPPPSATHPTDLKETLRYVRSEIAFMESFPSMRDDEALVGDDTVKILYPVLRASGLSIRQVALPGIPTDTDLDSYTDWTVGLVRQCIAAIARQVNRSPDELLSQALDDVVREIHGAKHTLARAQASVAVMEQQRQIPDADSLDLLLRYEAHLSRELRHSLHELQALQAMRLGGVAPLARVSVTGLEKQ